jgi:hypothetical protein
MDSSSEDEGPYTATNVTLGFAAQESTGDDISRLGGYPVRITFVWWDVDIDDIRFGSTRRQHLPQRWQNANHAMA